MKVIALFATINAGVIAFTPQAATKPRFATNLSAAKHETKVNNIVGGLTTFFAGLAVAGQVAFADPALLVDNFPRGKKHLTKSYFWVKIMRLSEYPMILLIIIFFQILPMSSLNRHP